LAIGAQPGGVDTVEVRRRFEILELPDVEIAFSRRSPAQKYVARMLARIPQMNAQNMPRCCDE
jgi:hypothetical protein